MKPCSLPYTRMLVGKLKWEIFDDTEYGGVTWRCHDDVTCGKINCEQPLSIDSLQMSPISSGQTRDQEAAVQWTFHWENQLFYFSALMIKAHCSDPLPVFCTSCTKCRPWLLPSRSEAIPMKNICIALTLHHHGGEPEGAAHCYARHIYLPYTHR